MRFIELRSELVTEMEKIDSSVEFLGPNSKYTYINMEHSIENVPKRLLQSYFVFA